LGRIPADHSFLLVADALLGAHAADRKLNAESLVEEIDRASRPVLVCPQCERIWLENLDSPSSYLEYQRVDRLGG